MNDSQYYFLKSIKDQIKRTTEALKKQYEEEARGDREPFFVQMLEVIPERGGNKMPIALGLKPQQDLFKEYCEKVRRIIDLHLYTNLHVQEASMKYEKDEKKYPFTVAEYQMLLKSKQFSCWLDDTIANSFNQLFIKTHFEAIGILRFILIERIFSHLSQAQPSDAEDNQSVESSIVHIQMEQLVSSRFNDISDLLNSLPDFIKAIPENARTMSPHCAQEYYSSLQRVYGFLAHFGIYNFTISQHFVLSDDNSAKELLLDAQFEKNQKILECQNFNDNNILKFFVVLKTEEDYVVEKVPAAQKPLPMSESVEESASEKVTPVHKNNNNKCQLFGWFSLFRKEKTGSIPRNMSISSCSNQAQQQEIAGSEIKPFTSSIMQ